MILQTRALIFLLQKPGKFSHLVELLLLLLNRARVIVSPLSAFFSLVGSLGIEGVSGWCSGMAGAASGLGREILSPFLHPPSPLPSPSRHGDAPSGGSPRGAPGRAETSPSPEMAGGEMQTPCPTATTCTRTGPPRARRDPCTCPSTPALQPLLPAALRGSPCPPVPTRRAGRQRDAGAGMGRIGSE